MFVDTHAHLTGDELFQDVHAVIERARAAHLETIINICTSINTFERGISLQKQYPWILQAGGIHPHDAASLGETQFSFFEEKARQGKLVAIGETGLDYFYDNSPREEQRKFLLKHAQLAEELNLPLIIHCRDAFSDLFDLLHNKNVILHCFTGNEQDAAEVIRRGWYLSLSGIVTFKKSDILKEVAKKVPLDKLLIETDAPFLAPMPYRGKQNEPSYLPYTAKIIAELRKIPLEELAKRTTFNAKSVFGQK